MAKTKKQRPRAGIVLWQGASEIDGQPIVLIATGLNGSRNRKTGRRLVQLYILRADVAPLAALKSGADASICGDCRHRGRVENDRIVDRSCYVNVGRGPRVVWNAWRRGAYEAVDAETAAAILLGRWLRLGAYGDPAAVPDPVWRGFLPVVAGTTGYSHQWRRAEYLRRWAMASADTAGERNEARAAGWRTFRVRTASESLAPREIACPASAEAGKRTTCDACRACGGWSSRARVDIAIAAHGIGRAAFERAA